MKKSILFALVLLCVSFMLCANVFAAEAQTITFSCDTTNGFSKEIIIETQSNVTINWGDNTGAQEITASLIDGEEALSQELIIDHTYLNSGIYNVTLTASGITRLEMPNNSILGINLSNATLIESLDLSENKLEELVFTKNSSLKDLDCSSNYLSTLNLSVLSLQVLNCSGNNLTSLIIPNTITELNASNNELEVINLSNMSNLRILECSDNYLQSIELTNCRNLEVINVINNFISTINFANNENLKEINCTSNNLSELNVSNNLLLEKLNCSGNAITQLNISNNNALKELYVVGNKISNINLCNIACEFIVLDNDTTFTNSSSSALIKVGIEGGGGIPLVINKHILFSMIPSRLLINDIEQSSLEDYLDFSLFAGETTVLAIFPENNYLNMFINRPQVLEGMLPVKHNGNNWVITNYADPEWYDYANNRWANIMLRDDCRYVDLDGSTLTSV